MIISRSRTESLYPLRLKTDIILFLNTSNHLLLNCMVNMVNLTCLSSMDQGKSGWYLLQTNYDHWKNPLIIDDRRTPVSTHVSRASSFVIFLHIHILIVSEKFV